MIEVPFSDRKQIGQLQRLLAKAKVLAHAVEQFSGLCVDACKHDDCANLKRALADFQNRGEKTQKGGQE